MVLLFDFMGIMGMVLLLVAFTLNVKKHTRRRTLLFNSLNFVGAMLLCLYAILIQSTVFIALQLIWSIIALYYIFSIVHERHIKPRYAKRNVKVKRNSKK